MERSAHLAFWRHLFRRRRRSHILAASPIAAVATAGDAASEHGRPSPFAQRRYLEGVPSLLPKDPLEDQRLNYQDHALYRTLSNHSLVLLSPEHTRTILDVGTGTGIWAFEMQTLFPHALIVGGDVSLQSLPQPVSPTWLRVQNPAICLPGKETKKRGRGRKGVCLADSVSAGCSALPS